MAHNHPSGDPEPSEGDLSITKRLGLGRPQDRRSPLLMTSASNSRDRRSAGSPRLDALEQEAQAEKLEGGYAFAPIVRADMLLDAGQPEAALRQVALGMQRGQKPGLPGATVNAVRRAGLTTRTAVEARLGKVEDAAKTLALLEAEAKAAPANAGLQSQLQFGRGELALARGEAKAAAEAFARCIEQDSYAHWRQTVALEKAGDVDGAAQGRKKLLSANRRDGEYLYVRSQLSAGQTMTGRKD